MGLRLGRYTLHAVEDGTFALDGGAMFGVVPKTLWAKKLPADAENRVRLSLRCLLLVDGPRKILVDDGLGDGWSEKHQAQYGIDRSSGGVEGALGRLGLGPEEITDVVLTHLHFDHAGGTVKQDGEPRLTFPNATYHLQRRNWAWAHHPTEKDRGSFLPDRYRLLEDSGRLHLLEGATELYPGIELFLSEGHTVGLQLVRVTSGEHPLVYCGDLIPTVAHLRASWVMAYDLYPLTTVEEKRMILADALENDAILFFEHDPSIAACTVHEEDGQAVPSQVIAL